MILSKKREGYQNEANNAKKQGSKKLRDNVYLRKRMGGAVWFYATRRRDGIFFAEGGDFSDKPLQVLDFQIHRQPIHVFVASIFPEREFASLKRLNSTLKEIHYNLDT